MGATKQGQSDSVDYLFLLRLENVKDSQSVTSNFSKLVVPKLGFRRVTVELFALFLTPYFTLSNTSSVEKYNIVLCTSEKYKRY